MLIRSDLIMRLSVNPPALILYTAHGLHLKVGGMARFCFVVIRPKYRNDVGLLAHELEHVKQFWQLWLFMAAVNAPIAWLISLWWLPIAGATSIAPWTVAASLAIICAGSHRAFYMFSREYRLRSEVAAFRAQMAWPNQKGEYLAPIKAANLLADPERYDLGIDISKGLWLLK